MYIVFATDIKKLWNVKVTVVPGIVGVRGTVRRRPVKNLEEIETRRNWTSSLIVFLKSPWIRILILKKDLLSLACALSNTK